MKEFQQTLSHFSDSPSSFSITADDKMSYRIVSISKQDQDMAKGSPSFVSESSSNSLNSKKANGSPLRQPTDTHIEEEQEILDSANGSYPLCDSVCLSPGSEGFGPKTSGNYEFCFSSDSLFVKFEMGKIVNNEKESFFSDLVGKEVKDNGKSEMVNKKKQLLLLCGENFRDVNGFVSTSKIVDENINRLKGINGPAGCPLGIKVLDETALIEHIVPFPKIGNCSRKEVECVFQVKSTKKHRNMNVRTDDEKKGNCIRRKSKGEKKALQFDVEEDYLCLKNKERTELAYSRDVLMALRFVNKFEQRKKWKDIYTGLGPVVGKEYDDLVTFYPQKSNHLHFDPRQRFGKKEGSPAIFGLRAARGRSNHMNVFVH